MPKKKLEAEESTVGKLAHLRAENKHLSEALKMAEWMSHAKDVMIDEAEKTFNIPIIGKYKEFLCRNTSMTILKQVAR